MQYKTALVTGASSGLGAAFAQQHAQTGGHLILTARNEKQLQDLAVQLRKTYHVEVAVLPADLSQLAGAEQLFQSIQNLGWEVDLLLNNAGFGDMGIFKDADGIKLQEMIAVNVTALTALTHLLVPQMVARKHGAILNVGSVASYFPGPGMAVYYATKAYVLSFSEALAVELAPHNIRVSALCPGPTATGFQKTANMDMNDVMGGLFANMPSAAEVAAYGYQSLMNGKRIAIHGFTNRLLIATTKCLPTSWKAAIMGRIQMQRVGR